MFHKFRHLKHKCQSTKKTFICQSVGEEERTKNDSFIVCGDSDSVRSIFICSIDLSSP